MHLRLLLILTLFSNAMMMLTPAARKDSGIKDTSEVCRNCQECSHDNGCLRCPEKLFLFLQREGVWHHGSCLHSCPAGHYGVRGRGVNRCMKCKAPSCDSCFSRDFCTKCKPGFQLFKGKCLHNCPEDTYPHLTDCLVVSVWSIPVCVCGDSLWVSFKVSPCCLGGTSVLYALVCEETQNWSSFHSAFLGLYGLFVATISPRKQRRRHTVHQDTGSPKLLEFGLWEKQSSWKQPPRHKEDTISDVKYDCELLPWSEWTSCRRKGLSCGSRWGRQSRSRQKSSLCPAQSEYRKCPMQKRCPGERREAEKKCERKMRGKQRNLCKDGMVTDAPEGPKRHTQGKENGQVQQQIRL